MHLFLLRLLMAALVFITVPVRAARTPDCAACNAASPNFDKGSGLCLPGPIDGLETAKYSSSDHAAMRAFRDTRVVGYNRPLHRLAITAYLFDREADSEAVDTKELRNTITEILQSHKGAVLEASGKTDLLLGSVKAAGFGGMFRWSEGGDDFASFLWIVPRGSRYLKLRASYVRPHGGEGEAMGEVIKVSHKVAGYFCHASGI
jgi:hypothetical protein